VGQADEDNARTAAGRRRKGKRRRKGGGEQEGQGNGGERRRGRNFFFLSGPRHEAGTNVNMEKIDQNSYEVAAKTWRCSCGSEGGGEEQQEQEGQGKGGKRRRGRNSRSWKGNEKGLLRWRVVGLCSSFSPGKRHNIRCNGKGQ